MTTLSSMDKHAKVIARQTSGRARLSIVKKETDQSQMDYEAAAKKLITYSNALAKGALSNAYGMARGEEPVLEYLSRQKDGMSPSNLADELGYTRPRMTRILDSLESKGLVIRKQDEADRRRVTAYCTDEGYEHVHDRSSNGVSQLADKLSQMGEHDVKGLLSALEQAYSITYNKDSIFGDSDDT